MQIPQNMQIKILCTEPDGSVRSWNTFSYNLAIFLTKQQKSGPNYFIQLI